MFCVRYDGGGVCSVHVGKLVRCRVYTECVGSLLSLRIKPNGCYSAACYNLMQLT